MLFIFAFISTTTAQRHELGVFVGASNYNGELNPGPVNLNFIHPAFGVMYRFNKSKHVSYKLNAYYGWISGNDAQSSDTFQLKRNLSFFSHLFDVSGVMEFNFFPFIPGTQDINFTPYIFAGFSIFHFNPTADFQAHNYELRTMHTEGEPAYGQIGAAFPFGGGFKMSVTQVINIGFELGVRKAYTNYLDDVSTIYPDPKIFANNPAAAGLSNKTNQTSQSLIGRQRGNPNGSDWYNFAGFWITFNVFKIGKHSCEAFPKFRY